MRGVYEAWDENQMVFTGNFGYANRAWKVADLAKASTSTSTWVMVDPGTDRNVDPDTLGSMDC